jgi:hypothetical protein
MLSSCLAGSGRIRILSQIKGQEKIMTEREPNPKIDPPASSNTEKDPDQWVSGGDPMTGAQASYLKTLSEECGSPEAFEEGLSKAEASKRIDALKSERQGTA